MTTSRFTLRTIVQTRSDGSRHLGAPGDAVLVERGRPRLLLLLCPCGCGDELVVNLDPHAGPAWRLYQERYGRQVSLFPSVWRRDGCRSHFIVWRDRILLLGRGRSDWESPTQASGVVMQIEAIRERLSVAALRSFADIADELGAVPWDTLAACRQLVRMGFAYEGHGDQEGFFGRLETTASPSNRTGSD